MRRGPATIRRMRRFARRGGLGLEGHRALPEETPVAFSFNGVTHAVMMATPADLADFAIGFALGEGIVGDAGEIGGPDIVLAGGGIDLQMT
ncbi:MAG: formate dehydrogenase accessory sulfurtransferase FdhD, partial [Rhizobiaceae bacterium]